ncbi:MAG: NYN domain-containing protein [Patescibacteria group bacterium]
MITNLPKAKAYIDGANMFYIQKDIGFFIDWDKIKQYLKERWDILEIRYYVGVKKDDQKMMGYLRYLDKIGVTSITKPLKIIKIDKNHILAQSKNFKEIYKCNFDVEMTTDILLDRSGIKEIILFSGDSDFDYLAKKLKDLGNKVIVFSSRKMLSWELKLTSKRYIYLEDLEDKIKKE